MECRALERRIITYPIKFEGDRDDLRNEYFFDQEGKITNISKAGACLICQRLLKPNQFLRLYFFGDKGFESTVTIIRSRVVWIGKSRYSAYPFRYGLHFFELEDQEKVFQFL